MQTQRSLGQGPPLAGCSFSALVLFIPVHKEFTAADGRFSTSIPGLRVWLFTAFMETLSLAAFLLANPSPGSWVTPHKAAALNICLSKIHPSSFTKVSRTFLAAELCFSRATLRQKQTVHTLVTNEESPVSGTNPEGRPGSCLKPWTTDTEKKKRIKNKLISYFHNLILCKGVFLLAFQFLFLDSLKCCPQPV